jgi:hypothetical protein
MRYGYKIIIEDTRGKNLAARPRLIGEDKIKMNL